MRITLLITKSMMLAMYCNPLFGDHACGQPQPKSHGMSNHRMKSHATMCLATVQKQSHAHYGNVRDYQGVN
jgi:hypothetical protein